MWRPRRSVDLFPAQEGGNIGTLFALMLVPVALLSGGTVDVGRTLAEKARIQGAADAAALAAARPMEASTQERGEIATVVFKANMANAIFPDLTPNVTVQGNLVIVEATAHVETPFLNLASLETLPAVGHATAVAGSPVNYEDPGKICLLALDPQSLDGIHLQGANQVNYVDCWAHTNSRMSTAINANGSEARAVGKGHCAVGSYTQSHDTFTPLPTTGCREVPDPFATVGAYVEGQAYVPAFTPPYKATTCKASNLNLKKGNFTLDPGRYCGGIDIKAGAKVTLNPGIYYIDNGVLNVQSGSTLTGSNVLFYLSGASARFQVIGGGTINLSGRIDAASYAGFLLIADANANRGGVSNIEGGGVFKLQGTIYVPTQRIEVAGSGDINALDVDVFGMVAKDFYFRGNGVFNAKRHNGSGNVPDIMPHMPVEGIRETALQ